MSSTSGNEQRDSADDAGRRHFFKYSGGATSSALMDGVIWDAKSLAHDAGSFAMAAAA